MFHACLFCVKPAVLGDAVIVFLDLETTGLSVLTDHIVEIGCVDAKGVVFTTVVNPLVMSSGPAVDLRKLLLKSAKDTARSFFFCLLAFEGSLWYYFSARISYEVGTKL